MAEKYSKVIGHAETVVRTRMGTSHICGELVGNHCGEYVFLARQVKRRIGFRREHPRGIDG